MSGIEFYTIEYLESVVKHDIPKLPKRVRTMVKNAIEQRLMVDPIGYGKPLQYSLIGHRRLRVSNYRIVYRIEPDTHTVLIVAISHRKDVYQ